jgi:parallel beta-helix repeat protein
MQVIKKSVMVLSVFMLLASSLLVGFPLSRVNSSQGTVEQSNPNGYVSEWNYTWAPAPWQNEVRGVAVDSNDNVIAAGSYGNGTGSYPLSWNITKWNGNGVLLWNYTYNSGFGNNVPYAVAVGSDDSFVVVGFCGINSSDYGWMIMKFDMSNNELWNVSFSPSSSYACPNAVAIDKDNNITVVGNYKPSSQSNDYGWAILKLDKNGNQLWNKTYNPSDFADFADGVAVDKFGNTVVVGACSTSSSHRYWNVTKFDGDGGSLWNFTWDFSPYFNQPSDVAVDHNDNIIVVGSDQSQGQNTSEWRIIKLDENGSLLWDYQDHISPWYDTPHAVAVDSDNNITVVGVYSTAYAAYAWRIRKIGYDKQLLWDYSANFSGFDDEPASVVIDHKDAMIVAGWDESHGQGQEQWRIMKFRSLSSRVHDVNTGLNYATIQEAIDANETLDGHTLLVDAGTYYENLVVNKTVSLVGENPQNTIIDGGGFGSVVTIVADYVNVTGFTMLNSTAYWSNAGINLNGANYCNITENNITNNWDGIYLRSSSNNSISGNNITANNYAGIWLESSNSNNSISGNNITANTDTGIWLGYSSHNSISGNNIAATNWAGIDLDSSSGNTLSGNVFTDDGLLVFDSYQNSVDNNTVNGKPLVYLEGVEGFTVGDAGQVILVNCDRIRVENLNLSRTTVGVQLWATNDSIISLNNITANRPYSIKLDYSFNDSIIGNNITANHWAGIYLGSSSGNRLSGNNITGLDGFGIELLSSSGNSISGNYVANNYRGIELSSSSGNSLSGNNITANSIYGILLYSSSNNTIYHNNFINNTQQLFFYGSGYVDTWNDDYPSGGNYWSNYAGADLHSGSNQNETGSDGIGDTRHVIDENNTDRYPLVAPYSAFDAGTWNETLYGIDVVSNSTVSDFHFDPDEGPFLEFNVTGQEGTVGFCRAAIPKSLLWAENGLTVYVGEESVNYTIIPDNDYTYLYFTYDHSTKTVEIQGTHAIPEFPLFLILPLFMIVTLLAALVHRRKPASGS